MCHIRSIAAIPRNELAHTVPWPPATIMGKARHAETVHHGEKSLRGSSDTETFHLKRPGSSRTDIFAFREEGTTPNFLRIFDLKSMPHSGLDCLVCAIFARWRHGHSGPQVHNLFTQARNLWVVNVRLTLI